MHPFEWANWVPSTFSPHNLVYDLKSMVIDSALSCNFSFFFYYVTRIERVCSFLSLYLRPKQCNIFLYSKNVNYIIYITKMEFHFNNCIFIFLIKISGEPIKMAKPSILGVRYRQLGQHLLDPLCQLWKFLPMWNYHFALGLFGWEERKVEG